jgi:hypothetical protein
MPTRKNAGTSREINGFRSGQELPMQAIVERVIRTFTLKSSPSSENGDGNCRTPAELAADLLENYKAHLLQRAQPPRSR